MTTRSYCLVVKVQVNMVATPAKVHLLEFNAIGMLTITPRYVTASVTVIYDGKTFTARTKSDLEKSLPYIESDESVAVLFGVYIEQNKKRMVIMEQFGKLRSEYDPTQYKIVTKLAGEAIDLVRLKVGID